MKFREVEINKLAFFVLLFTMVILGCGKKNEFNSNALFQLLSPDSTNVYFANTITTSDSINIFTFEYLYNGAGAGIGDFNGDNLPDIFFNGSNVASALYLNKGGLHFENISATAGIVIEKGWPFGVCVIDINQDGLADIYLSIGGPGNKDIYPNKLFVNQGLDKNQRPYFKEMAAEYGLADAGQSIQAVFFDYDRDGDLDMYQLTGGGFEKSPIVPHPIAKDGSSRNTDRLYRNDFNKLSGHALFTNVSKQAGILTEGYGLGVSIIDINEDEWQDVYVTNDYLTNDLLYINNHDGTFSENAQQYFKHTSHFAMGNDVGDINNDGLVDFIAVDMLPEEHSKRMLMFGPNQYDKFYYSISQGYSYQYMRNTLQLNRGNGEFSEIGQMAGIYKTSWSWAPLFADLDNDGFQDIFISNGFGKDITDLDFVKFRSDISRADDTKNILPRLIDSLSARPGIKTHPYVYKNNGDLTFTDASRQWGFDAPTYSNGAVYADLDNDGDLDIITNNIDETAHIYRNNTVEKSTPGTANFIRVKLTGTESNKMATGSKVDIKYNGQMQTRNMNTVRGFESSVDAILHFGMGNQLMIDSVIVYWPDGNISTVTNVKTNQLLTINYKGSTKKINSYPKKINQQLFTELSPASLQIKYKNKHNDFNDFNYERLIPKKYSQSGPGIAAGDVNGDGLEDFFVGGAYQQSGEIYTQNKNGAFTSHLLSNGNDGSEDAGCLLFDMDSDNDLDLYVVSGGNEFTANHKLYQSRVYKNDGKGNFSKDETALPEMHTSGSCIVAADYDKDGDLDLFVGGGIVPGLYPQTPASYILQNNNGKFIDVTESIAPGLKKTGMVNAALWTDTDNDGNIDLILAGEWMPITLFKNTNGKFINTTVNAGLNNSEGWWQSLVSGDFDNDGDMDYVAGNWGLNNPYKASAAEPMSICYNDFDHNGSIDPILCYYEDGINYPAMPWDYLIDQLPSLRKKLPTYASYATLSMEKLLPMLDNKGMQRLNCKMLYSVYLQNDGHGKFTIKKLPAEAQFAPMLGMMSEDINQDGNLDLISVGNFYGTDVVTGRYDASMGLVMYGDSKGNFKPASIAETGFVADNDSKAIARISTADNKPIFVVTQNSDSIKVFKQTDKNGQKNITPLQNETVAIVTMKNGSKRRIETGFGNSYLSQSSRSIIITKEMKQLELYNNKQIKTRFFDFDKR